MCGIIGYYGNKQPKDVIISGLKSLEYRGYDSSGIAVYDKKQIKRIRAEGKLSNLVNKLEGQSFDGKLGIGHTRWATHGVPSERNAHPHSYGGITLVHNGIIENYMEIKAKLLANNAKIESDTDSELVAHLIDAEVKLTKDLRLAVQNVIETLHGAYVLVVVWDQSPDEMVAVKNGPPLVVGVGTDEIIVASDVQAVLPYTKNVIFLEDGEMIASKLSNYEVYSANGFPIKKEINVIDWNPEAAAKSGYAHFMLKEIYEQPRVVASAMEPHIDLASKQVFLKNLGLTGSDAEQKEKALQMFAGFERVFVIACGTSYYAGLFGEYVIENLARVPVEVELASEFRYRNPIIPKNSLAIVISQSGETADTLAALRLAKESGAKILDICNVHNSSIDRASDIHMYMRADVEIGVASTKAFTASMAILNLIAVFFAKAKKVLKADEEFKIVDNLLALPSQMEKVLAYDKYFNEAADGLKQSKGFLYIGRGASYPIALEGALKLKELAYMHAEGYAAGEMKHGPIALIDNRMMVVVVAPKDDVYEKTISNLEEVRARGGKVISISSGKNAMLEDISEHYLAIPECAWYVSPLLSVIPLQLMSYHVADKLGLDVDQPRNLAKSVTVE